MLAVALALTAARGQTSAVQSKQPIPHDLVKDATAVKDRHIDRLSRLPAVVGVGVGASDQHPGKAVILIYVSRKLKEKERRAFPRQLEGVPVEIEVSGPFVALPEGSKAREGSVKK